MMGQKIFTQEHPCLIPSAYLDTLILVADAEIRAALRKIVECSLMRRRRNPPKSIKR